LRALLLGATGVVGRAVAGDLGRARDVERLFVAGRDRARVEWITHILGGPSERVTGLTFDLTDERATRRAMAGLELDIVASCAGPAEGLELAGIRAAIEASASWVSLCDDHQVSKGLAVLGPQAVAANVTVVPGCGLSPGITNLLIALAAAELESLEEIEIAVAGASLDAPGTATALQFLAALRIDAPLISDHQPTSTRPAGAPKLVYFPEPVGWVETFRSGRPEIITLPHSYPSLRSLQFRMGIVEKALMDLARATAAVPFGSSEAGRRAWLRIGKPFRRAIELVPPTGRAWTAARVDVRGIHGGHSTTISLGVVDHLANLAALPLAQAALTLGSGRIARAGVHAPDQVFDAREFLSALTRRGIRVARLEPYPL